MKVEKAPENTIGWTHECSYVDSLGGDCLTEQLAKKKISYLEIRIPHLAGVHAWPFLVMYTSPISGKHVVVLTIHDRYEIDDWAERYYYFEGMSKEQALASEQFWLDAYDTIQEAQGGPKAARIE
jgi:hypothetical protein